MAFSEGGVWLAETGVGAVGEVSPSSLEEHVGVGEMTSGNEAGEEERSMSHGEAVEDETG